MIIKTPHFELAVYLRGDLNAKKVMLLLPGKLDTKDYAHMRSHVDYFATHDYLACAFDPPGTWESPGDIFQYTVTNYLRAIEELIVYFGNKPTVLMGHSRGGTMALLAGAGNNAVTHIIAVMSNCDPITGHKSTLKGVEISTRDAPTGSKRTFQLPVTYYEDAAKYNTREAAATCTKPKLFFVGMKDTIVPKESVKVIYEMASKPKQLYELDCDHDYRRYAEKIEEVNRVVEEFLEKYALE
ncbi:alpha/beta hydrolase [Candidatus Woesearchaeota archaeon]|nr:alpha/beta hydrolase [Candidatus Woesearchaeota archaeon]